jgi:hypothetical protein
VLDKVLSPYQPPGNPVDITYGDLLEKGRRLSAQLVTLMPLFRPPGPFPQPIALRPFAPVIQYPGGEEDGILRYLRHDDYVKVGPAALEHILMDQIGLLRIETAPDRLTTSRLRDVFAPCLIRSRVDLEDPMDAQLRNFFSATQPFVEFTRGICHERLADRYDVLQAVMGKLAHRQGATVNDDSSW